MPKGKVHLKAKQFSRKFACGRIRGIAYVEEIFKIFRKVSRCVPCDHQVGRV